VDALDAVLALLDPRRDRHVLDQPDHGLLVALVVDQPGRLARLAADADLLGTRFAVVQLLDPAVVDHPVLQWLAGLPVAHQGEVDQERVHVAGLQPDRPGAVGLHVTAPFAHALVPVVTGGLVAGLDQYLGAVAAGQRPPLVAVDLEDRALVQAGQRVADVQAVAPAVVALWRQGHRAGGLHAHVAGLVVGAEWFDGERWSRGKRQDGAGHEAADAGGRVWQFARHHSTPLYSIRRRS